jgi:poly(3-hydroxybutyrate) depolymerase
MMAAAVLFAAAAIVAGLVGAIAPANAVDQYIALSLGYINENPPVTMAGGSAIAASQDQAATAFTNQLCEQWRQPLREPGHCQ